MAALLVANRRAPQSAAEVTGPAVPGLIERMPKLEEVVICTASGTVATLKRGAERWTLEERAYPADEAALRKFLLTLARARQIEQKTDNPELYSRLGVESLDQADARGALVELRGAGDPIRLIVGDNTTRGEGTYVRGADDPQSWLIDSNVAVETQTANWLDRALTDIKMPRVASVHVTTGKDVVEIKADDEASGDFKLVNLPKGREVASDYIADSVAGWLQDLRMEDVAADEGTPQATWTLQFRSVDGLVIDVGVWKQDDKSWARFSASLDEAAMSAAIAEEQAKASMAWESQQARLNAEAMSAAEAADGTAEGSAAEATNADGVPGEEVAPQDTDGATDSASVAALASDTGSDADAVVATSEPTGVAADAPLAVRDPVADRAEREQAIRDELAQLVGRFEGRRFQIPTHKSANVERKLEDYLKPRG
ncbi:MAG: DUF4340 domain-containing protein [Xanthomonadales bacterium]|nr:DUF4340 domain-containing protein [Xanthomonadales bacterium]